MPQLLDLPNELLDYIFSFNGNNIALMSNVALVSKRFAHIARHHILRSVRFVLVNTDYQIAKRETPIRRVDPRCRGKPSFELFKELIQNHPACADLVRGFTVDVEARWRANPPWGRDYTPDIYEILGHLRNLETLDASLPGGNAGPGSYIPASHPSLRELSLTKSHMIIDHLIDYLLEPNCIESLSVNVAGFQESDSRKQIFSMDEFSTQRSLKRLQVNYTGRNVSAIRALIAISHRLEWLKLSLYPDQGNCSPATLFPTEGDAPWLRNAKETLTELHLTGGRRGSSTVPPIDLSSFVMLKRATLSDFTLVDLGAELDTRCGAYRRLPRCLEDLEIVSKFNEADMFHASLEQARNRSPPTENNVQWLLELPLNKPNYFHSLSNIIWSEIIWRDQDEPVRWTFPPIIEETFAASAVGLTVKLLSNVAGSRTMYTCPSDDTELSASEVTTAPTTAGFSLELLQHEQSSLASLQQESSYTSHSTQPNQLAAVSQTNDMWA